MLESLYSTTQFIQISFPRHSTNNSSYFQARNRGLLTGQEWYNDLAPGALSGTGGRGWCKSEENRCFSSTALLTLHTTPHSKQGAQQNLLFLLHGGKIGFQAKISTSLPCISKFSIMASMLIYILGS